MGKACRGSSHCYIDGKADRRTPLVITASNSFLEKNFAFVLGTSMDFHGCMFWVAILSFSPNKPFLLLEEYLAGFLFKVIYLYDFRLYATTVTKLSLVQLVRSNKNIHNYLISIVTYPVLFQLHTWVCPGFLYIFPQRQHVN